MAHTIKISDGTTTIDFLGSNYKILSSGGWSPKRAQRNPSAMGAPYLDVVETMSIQVESTTGADCLDKLGTLSDLLDQAEAWGRGENVTAVYIEYEPPASALASSVKAVITGPPSFGDFLTMPARFGGVQLANNFVIGENNDPIYLSFTRRGLWLGATEAKTSAVSTGNPAILTPSNFTYTHDILGVYDIYIKFELSSSETDAAGGLTGSGYLVTVNSSDKVLLQEAEGFSSVSNPGAGSQGSAVVAAASAGNVWQLVPNAIGTYVFKHATLLDSLNSNIRIFDVFTKIRNIGSVNWTVEVDALDFAASEAIGSNKGEFVIDTSSSNTRLIWMGRIHVPKSPSAYDLRISATSDAASGSGHELQFDYVVVVGIDESTNIVQLDRPVLGSSRAYIEHQLDSDLEPRIYFDTAAGSLDYFPPYGGNLLLSSNSNSISVLMFGSGSNVEWVFEDISDNELDYSVTVTKTNSYLTPL